MQTSRGHSNDCIASVVNHISCFAIVAHHCSSCFASIIHRSFVSLPALYQSFIDHLPAFLLRINRSSIIHRLHVALPALVFAGPSGRRCARRHAVVSDTIIPSLCTSSVVSHTIVHLNSYRHRGRHTARIGLVVVCVYVHCQFVIICVYVRCPFRRLAVISTPNAHLLVQQVYLFFLFEKSNPPPSPLCNPV